MKYKILILLAFITGFTNAQEQLKNYSFTLQEAINHAVQYNYNAINSGRDIEAAKKKKWETTTMGLPQINALIEYQNNFELQKSLIPAEIFGGTPGEFTEVAFGTNHSVNARATLSQLIFDGSYIVGLQAAKTYLDFYKNAKSKTNIEIKELITNAYGNVLLLEESISIYKKNKATLEKNFNDATQTFKNGLIEEENVEQIAITLATVNSALKNTQRLKAISLNMLKIYLGIELTNDLKLTDSLDNLTTSNLELALSNEDFNINTNIDYLIGLNNQEQKRLLLMQEKSKALPSLSANVNFGYNAFNNEFRFLENNQRWLNYSNMGVSLNVPIFSSLGRSARTQQANIALDQSKTNLKELEQVLTLKHQQAKSNFEFSIEEYLTAKSNLNLAERIENKQQIKFKEGLSTSFEFSEAQRQLYTAQQNYLQSMINVINKKATLETILTK